MNMKITSTAIAAFMIAGTTSFSAFASMGDGSVVIGTKAYDLAYANDPANATEITAAVVAGGAVYVKDFNGNWIDNVTGLAIDASVIPAVTYTNASGTTQIGAGDASTTAASSATVTAINATSFKAVFNGPVADPTKVTFNTTREGTPVTLTTSWNAANTEATLTYASNLPEDSYLIDVTNNGVDYGSSTVAVTAQKIAKIEITSTALGVESPTTDTTTGVTTGGNGFATYSVLDQYGNDISTSALAQGITWTCGVGTATGSNGLLTVTPFSGATNFLTSYTTATINGIDQTSGVTATQNLTVTQNQGTLSDVKLNSLYCTNNPSAVFAAGDTTDSFYLNYSATDLSGNPTTNYDLIKAGLMSSNGAITGLISSNPSAVTASLVTDPSNSNNALIQVTPTSDADSVVADQPIVITVFTSNGKAESINLTLKKAATLSKFTLMAPNTTVAAGDKDVIIPFSAVDQNGLPLTKYSDLVGKVNFSGSFDSNDLVLQSNPDGTASLVLTVPADAVADELSSQSYTIQAVTTSTGQYSSLNIVVQAAATPNTLSVTSTQAVPNMESGAVQNLDFGANYADLAVKDQFGRVMDMTNQNTTAGNAYYYVSAAVQSGTSVTVNPAANKAYGDMNIQLDATGAVGSGSSTIAYTVMEHNADGTDVAVPGITPITTQYTVLGATDIKSYELTTVAPLYDVNGGATTAKQSYIGTTDASNRGDYEATPAVYGLTSAGGKVALKDSDIINASIDNTADFTASKGDVNTTSTAGTPEIGVYANDTLNSTKTTATGNLNVTIAGQDGLTYTAITPVSSLDTTPTAQSVGFNVTRANADDNATANSYANPTWSDIDVSGNNITMSAAQFTSNVVGNAISKWNEGGATETASYVYLYGIDQYGTDNAPISTFLASTTSAGYTLSVDPNTHILTVIPSATAPSSPTTGDVITLTGVTSNGLIDSVNIKLAGTDAAGSQTTSAPSGTVTTPTTTAAAAAALVLINAGTETDSTSFTTAGITGVVAANYAAYKTAIAATEVTVGSALTLAQVQTQVTNVNTAAGTATSALALINAGTETDSTSFTTAGITGVVVANYAAYETAIAATKVTIGSDLTLAQVQTQVTNVNTEATKETAATALVVTAEGSKTQADKTAAQTAVTALNAGSVQTALQTRISAIVVPVANDATLNAGYTFNAGLGVFSGTVSGTNLTGLNIVLVGTTVGSDLKTQAIGADGTFTISSFATDLLGHYSYRITDSTGATVSTGTIQ